MRFKDGLIITPVSKPIKFNERNLALLPKPVIGKCHLINSLSHKYSKLCRVIIVSFKQMLHTKMFITLRQSFFRVEGKGWSNTQNDAAKFIFTSISNPQFPQSSTGDL